LKLKYAKLDMAWIFGWSNPSAIVVVGYDGDGRVWVLDEFYQAQAGAERIVLEAQNLVAQYGSGPFLCDPSEPETISKMKAGGLNASPYGHKREEGLRELGARFQKAGDGRPRIYISSRCVNLISELLEYRVDVKERDHACDALRYSLKLGSAAPLRAFRFG
jgi:hypothetical protein